MKHVSSDVNTVGGSRNVTTKNAESLSIYLCLINRMQSKITI